MKVMGVVGSPRHGGNTGSLVQRVLEGVESRGGETVCLYLSDYQIHPCRACEACKTSGRCVQEDDMRVFYSAIEEARGLVVGTPIYLDHVSAQTKVFLDRLYAYLGPALEHRFPKGVNAVLVFTWGACSVEAYDEVVEWLEDRLSGYFGITTLEVVKAADTEARPVRGREDLLERAFEAGARLWECGA